MDPRTTVVGLPGAVFVVTGVCLIFNKKARLAAGCLGFMILLLVVLIYVPIVVANPSDIANRLNYLMDTLLLSGGDLALAGALRVNLQIENPAQ